MCRSQGIEKIPTPSPVTVDRRTYGYCRATFASRNLLFRHIKVCEFAEAGEIRGMEPDPELPVAQPESFAFSVPPPVKYLIKEAPAVQQGDTPLFSIHTHLRLGLIANPTADRVEVCADPGTGRSSRL